MSYSDSYMFLDAAHRIQNGERPGVDFFSPMGPLPSYAFAIAQRYFPNVQPVLEAQLSVALIVGAALCPIVLSARMRQAGLDAALLFVLLAVSPYNWGDFKGLAVQAEADGYGIYNRDAGLLLFALVSAAWLVPARRVQLFTSSLLLAALFFTKITAFPLGLAVCAWGLLRRRAAPSYYLLVMAPTLTAAIVLQFADGLLLAYLKDMARIGRAGGLWSAAVRLKHEAEVAGPALLLLALPLAVQVFRDSRRLWRRRDKLHASLSQFCLAALRTRAFGFALLIAGAVFVESQNTGSQAFAFVAPAILALAPRKQSSTAAHLRHAAFLAPALAAILYLSASWTALAWISPKVTRLDAPGLAPFHVSARRSDIDAARTILDGVKRDPRLLTGAARTAINKQIDENPRGEILFLLQISDATTALDRWRDQNPAVRPTVAALDFVDPHGFLTGAAPLRGVDIVYDPERTIPPSAVAPLNQAWRRADVLLARRCFGVDEVVSVAAPALRGRQVISLDPCWDIYVAASPKPAGP